MSAAVLCVFSYGFFSTKFIKCWRCWRKMSKFEELVKKGADTPEPTLVFPRNGKSVVLLLAISFADLPASLWRSLQIQIYLPAPVAAHATSPP